MSDTFPAILILPFLAALIFWLKTSRFGRTEASRAWRFRQSLGRKLFTGDKGEALRRRLINSPLSKGGA